MTTNRDWLFSLPLEEQYAWMNAEHQERALDGDTAALNAKIAYPMHHGYKGVKADMVIFDELHDEHDSREKLEADAFAYLQTAYITYPQIIKLLDRQAAITAHQWESYHNGMMLEWMAKTEELQEQVDELKELNEYHALQYELASEDADRLQAQVDTLKSRHCPHYDATEHTCDVHETRIAELTAERERYRSKFGKCLDYADAIHALMDDEGMA